jgi:hypothetical protein
MNFLSNNTITTELNFRFIKHQRQPPSQFNQMAHILGKAASGTAGDPITFTQAMTLDASGNLLVGTTTNSEGAKLKVDNGYVFIKESGGADVYLRSAFTGPNIAAIQVSSNSPLAFATNNTERCRVTATGEFLVGKTAVDFTTAGISLRPASDSHFTRDGGNIIALNRLTNDGNLMEFAQASTVEGTISVSGSTVSYNGGHLSRWSQTTDNTRIKLLKGTVMTNLDQMAVWIDPETGQPQENEQLNCMKVSDVEGDPNVAGVFVNWDNDDDVFANDMNVAMTGDMIIRIAQGVTVQRGDLLMSAGDGTAKPQGDDIIRSKTIAKVTSNHVTCTYEDGSYCVPCVLMAC